jgi:hypothetical protein
MDTTLVIFLVIGLALLGFKLISWKLHFSQKARMKAEISDARALTEQTIEASGKAATLCVYRIPKFAGKLNLHTIYCDNAPIAMLKNGSYSTCEVSPGEHEISTPASRSTIRLPLEAGQEYYIRTGVTGLTGYVFEPVSKERGKSEIANLTRA